MSRSFRYKLRAAKCKNLKILKRVRIVAVAVAAAATGPPQSCTESPRAGEMEEERERERVMKRGERSFNRRMQKNKGNQFFAMATTFAAFCGVLLAFLIENCK